MVDDRIFLEVPKVKTPTRTRAEVKTHTNPSLIERISGSSSPQIKCDLVRVMYLAFPQGFRSCWIFELIFPKNGHELRIVGHQMG